MELHDESLLHGLFESPDDRSDGASKKPTLYEQATHRISFLAEKWQALCEKNEALQQLNIYDPSLKKIRRGGVNIIGRLISEDLHASCFTCHSLEAFKEELKKLGSSSFEGCIAYIVNSIQFQGASAAHHFSPVLVERRNGRTTIVITDSLGFKHDGENPESRRRRIWPIGKTYTVKEAYQRHLKGALAGDLSCRGSALMNLYMMINESGLENCKIWVFEPWRQASEKGCAFFSSFDAYLALRNPNFFQELFQNNKLEANAEDDRLSFFSWLPPEHFEMTESRGQIRNFLEISSSKGRLNDVLDKFTPSLAARGAPTNISSLKFEAEFLNAICEIAQLNLQHLIRMAFLEKSS